MRIIERKYHHHQQHYEFACVKCVCMGHRCVICMAGSIKLTHCFAKLIKAILINACTAQSIRARFISVIALTIVHQIYMQHTQVEMQISMYVNRQCSNRNWKYRIIESTIMEAINWIDSIILMHIERDAFLHTNHPYCELKRRIYYRFAIFNPSISID